MFASSSAPHLKLDYPVSGLVTFTICGGVSPGARGSRWFLQGQLRQRGAEDQQEPGLWGHLCSPGARALTHRPSFPLSPGTPGSLWDARWCHAWGLRAEDLSSLLTDVLRSSLFKQSEVKYKQVTYRAKTSCQFMLSISCLLPLSVNSSDL